eukprot:SAG31_NODE_41908_length_274_cov_0.577143_1_plen_85_part_01
MARRILNEWSLIINFSYKEEEEEEENTTQDYNNGVVTIHLSRVTLGPHRHRLHLRPHSVVVLLWNSLLLPGHPVPRRHPLLAPLC